MCSHENWLLVFGVFFLVPRQKEFLFFGLDYVCGGTLPFTGFSCTVEHLGWRLFVLFTCLCRICFYIYIYLYKCMYVRKLR